MKVIIPVAGAGTKLRPLTYTQPKALMPLAGKTILSVIVDQLLEAGLDDFVFVIGYLGEKIQDYLERSYPKLKYTLVQQTARKGTGHAIYLTKEAVGNAELMIVLGDTICDYNVRHFISQQVSQIAVRKVDDPRSFGVAELGEDDRVLRVVEKPLIPRSNMAMVGIYYIRETEALYDALEKDLFSNQLQDGEYHLTHALNVMLQQGIRMDGYRVNNWFDCGKKETLLSTNATLLRQSTDASQGLAPGAVVTDSVIIPPVAIAAGSHIRHSIIGPNVTIGENTAIHASIIRDSIIGSFAELEEVVLHSSIIGSDAYVRGMSQSLNIGDNTEIDLG